MVRDRSKRTDESTDENDVERCANCGDRIETGECHPVETARDADDEFVLLQFCTEACRDAWSDE